MPKKIDLVGKRFGKMIVIEEINSTKCHCLCDCGNYKVCRRKRLLDGRNTSCGCFMNRSGPDNGYWKGYEDITGSFWGSIRSGAENRKIELSISIKEAWEIFIKQNRRCALSGVLLNMPERQYSKDEQCENLASLDRIDSSKPYTKENCQWVTREINKMKMDMKEKRFIQVCKAVGEYS